MAKLLLDFSLCYFLNIIKNPHPHRTYKFYFKCYIILSVSYIYIYILLRMHICLHVFASFLYYIQISDFDLNIS